MRGIDILTTTFYRSTDELRFHLACQMIGNAIGAGYFVFIIDGSENPQIAKSFARIGATVFSQKDGGMGNSRRQLFLDNSLYNPNHAQPRICVWTEPEKVDLIRSIPIFVRPIVNGSADIVIMERTPLSLRSYPVTQVASEQSANKVYERVVGKAFDPMAGPVAWASNVNDYFANCDPSKYGAEDNYIQQIAPLKAMADGRRVVSVPIDFFYPQAQRHEEETNFVDTMIEKRTKQMKECSQAYRLAAQALNLHP